LTGAALLVPVAAWCATAPASAPVAAQPARTAVASTAGAAPFLWRSAGAAPFWLYGTIHLADDRVLALPGVVEQAVDGSHALFTEIPMDPATQIAMTPELMLPSGRTLRDIVPEALYGRLHARFEQAGLPLAALSQLKVWALTVQLPLLDRLAELAAKQPLDTVLYLRAQRAGKEVGGIETVGEQLGVFNGLDEAEQVQMLHHTLDLLDRMDAAGRDPVNEMVEAWVAGDGDRLLALIGESYDPADPLDAKLMQRLFHDRNRLMADRIAAKLAGAPGRSLFFAVGTGHVVGPGGLVELLAAKGLALERVAAAAGTPAPQVEASDPGP
jgi:hypothetical protein